MLFDSDKDNWSENTSVFDDRLMNKTNLIFVVEDTMNNKYGGYISSSINKYNDYINDSNAFVFSLKSNGRINGMRKFDITQPQYAIFMYQKSNSRLFRIGGGADIGVYKKNSNSFWTNTQTSFNYEGLSGVFRGATSMTNYSLKRFTVLQMK